MSKVYSHTTAVLIFANSSTEELKYKPFKKGQLLFDALTQHTLDTVKKTGLPYFHVSEKKQKGNTFGERFTNAVASVYEKGFNAVITIGNDSPQLKPQQLLLTAQHLEKNSFVLGPSHDGGFYLMGISKSQFKASIFKKFAWQTASLCNQIMHWAKTSSYSSIKLRALLDVDTQEDVKTQLNTFKALPKNILNVLKTILEFRKSSIIHITEIFHFYNITRFYNKGSPAFSIV